MWLIGGSKTTARKVKDGRSVRRLCADCNVVADFHEYEVIDKVNAFFVELFATTQRRLICDECGADHDVDELLAATPAAKAALPAKTAKAALPGAAPAKRGEPAKKADTDADVDEMLAALKRKIARK
jgi:hypothetical protein